MKRTHDSSSTSTYGSSQPKKSLTEMDENGTSELNAYQKALKTVNLVNAAPPDASALLATRQKSRHQHTADDIMDLAQQIADADKDIEITATGKLALIMEQMKQLQAQARKVLDEKRLSQRLNGAACNFRKQPGSTYHLYRRDTGEQQFYLSMLSPAEWGRNLPHPFEGSFRLEADSSWTPVDRLAERDQQNAWSARLMAATDEASAKSSFLALE